MAGKYEDSFPARWRTLRGNAKARGLKVTLTIAEAKNLMGLPCTYCGNVPLPWNTLDRSVPKLGYVPANVAPACTVCVKAKGSRSREDFLAWISRVAARVLGS